MEGLYKNFIKTSLVALVVLTGLFPKNILANNTWINYNQTYLGLKIANKGIYRLNYNDLAPILANLNTINPKSFQVIHNGQEIPIYINGEADNSFDNSDYIEFYGDKNDGWLDSIFFLNTPFKQPRKDLSYINDTATYFLTWNTSTNNKRLVSISNQNFTPLDSVKSVKKTVPFYPTHTYYYGLPSSQGGDRLGYSSTEGTFSEEITIKKNVKINYPTPHPEVNTDMVIEGAITGQSDYFNANLKNHHFRLTINNFRFDTIYKGYQYIPFSKTITSNYLSQPFTNVTLNSINDLNIRFDKQALAWMRIIYNQTLDANNTNEMGDLAVIPNTGRNKALVAFRNFNSNLPPIVYDLKNKSRISTQKTGYGFRFNIDFGVQKAPHDIHLSSEDAIKNPSKIFLINGNGKFTNFKNLESNNTLIIIYNKLLETSTNLYADYRKLDYNVLKVDIEELYHQFGYGVQKHPVSISAFAKFLDGNWTTTPPIAFLLIGKATQSSISRSKYPEFSKNLVPTYGVPGADILLMTGFSTHTLTPKFPIGRIAANSNDEVLIYLDKLKAYEQAQKNINDRYWTKRVIHLSGGTTPIQIGRFKGYLSNYEEIIKDTLYGAEVTTFEKSTSAVVQTSFSDSIKSLLKKGVALMTFFGHGSTTGGFDQNIEEPANWPNQNGKYPFLLANSCYSGNIHQSYLQKSISEQYVLEKDKGVIGFLASIDSEFSTALNRFSEPFYKHISYKSYGQPIGKIINTVVQSLTTANPSNTDTTAVSLTLHGDPLITLKKELLPDYTVTTNSLTISPKDITSSLDSFRVYVNIKNIGAAKYEQLSVTISRTYPFNRMPIENKTLTIQAPFNQTIVSLKFPVNFISADGLNQINVTLDGLQLLPEVSDLNNSTSINFLINAQGVSPVYPYNYSVIPKSTGISLKASTSSFFKKKTDYLMEIDTTSFFNSSIKQNTTISSKGGVLTWQPNSFVSNLPDSTVIFWRVAKKDIPSKIKWKSSSFQVINGINGWGQSHYHQFKENNFNLLKYNINTRLNTFQQQRKDLFCYTFGLATTSEINNIRYGINNDVLGYNGSLSNSALHLAVLDSLTLNSWNSNSRNLGQANRTGIKDKFFIYRLQSTTQQNKLAEAIIDSVPKGNYILVWSWFLWRLSKHAPFTTPLINAFNQIGASGVANLAYKYPFIFLAKKGDPSFTKEVLGATAGSKNLTLKQSLNLGGVYGEQNSVTIGPSSEWNDLFWTSRSLDNPDLDSNKLDLYGLKKGGSQKLIFKDISKTKYQTNLRGIDAKQYPYLKLVQKTGDKTNNTPSQLNYWYITHKAVTDLALNADNYFSFHKDTIDQGDSIKFSIAIENISQIKATATTAEVKISSITSQNTLVKSVQVPEIEPGKFFILSITQPTTNLEGVSTLSISVNPNQDPLEKHLFNNLGKYGFFVLKDKENPILDVTFDGLHILDKDIVSPISHIVVSLKDNHEFFLLDINSITITLVTPSQKRITLYNQGKTIGRTTYELPANSKKNIFQVNHTADFQEEGTYQLNVAARDKSYNKSGDINYIINFEVIRTSSITNVINYPNPFSTSTKFIFTLTGVTPPSYFKIQILTITGKIVKEITQQEIGALRIGNNITTYSWDGKDSFGDPLANGLYLYKVIAKDKNQEDFKHRNSRLDGFFKNGFGKLYILR